MELKIKKIQRALVDYNGNTSVQTGFPSPATHYREPVIDLNQALTTSKEATFYVRVKGNEWRDFNILDQDILVIDRALSPALDTLALVIEEGDFNVIRITKLKSQLELWGIITYIIHKAI